MALGPVLCGFLCPRSRGRRSCGELADRARRDPVDRGVRAESRAPDRGARPGGQVLMIAALATLTYAIIAGFDVILLALSLGCPVALMLYELHRREPLLELRFFPSAPLAGASAIAVCLSAALGGFLFMTTLYLQQVRGFSPMGAALFLLPTATMLIVFAPLSGPAHRPRRRAPVDGGRRPGGADERPAADRPEPGHPGAAAARRVRAVRVRLRAGQSADRAHRGLRHAARAGGRRRGGGDDQPAGRESRSAWPYSVLSPPGRAGGSSRRSGSASSRSAT